MTETFPTSHRLYIDGLRAIAVVPVLFFHTKISAFSGGYVGVDIFFVISGFLITNILVSDIDKRRFSILRFYERRVRRIIPALLLIVIVCTLISLFIFLPSDLMSFAQSVVATIFFVSNIWFWRRTEGYFAPDAVSEPLLHTWSLAVEEQFYIFFPALLYFLRNKPRKSLIQVLAAILIVSFAMSVWGAAYKPRAAFYLTPPRICELLLGSLVAVNALPAVSGRIVRELLAVFGLSAILVAIFGFSETTVFPGTPRFCLAVGPL